MPLEAADSRLCLGASSGIVDSEVHCYDTIAAARGSVNIFVIASGGINSSIPNVAFTAFVVTEFMCDLIVNSEMQGKNAVAAFDGLKTQLTVIDTRMVIDEAESMGVIYARLALPATAVVDGDVIVFMGGDVN